LLRVPVDLARWHAPAGDVGPILDQFAKQRSVADVPSLIAEWLAFLGGAGVEGNPLLRGHGIPSAVVIDSLLGAAGYDLCPGVDSAATCPEAFWQTAKWWTQYLEALNIVPLTTRHNIPGEDQPSAPLEKVPSFEPAMPRIPRLPTSDLTERLFTPTTG